MSSYTLHHSDCLDILRTMEDSSVDSIVTDPPYGLSFMGKKWDYDVPSTEVWSECARVLKPGGHLLAFAGTRTQHRMAVRIEDAGFEIRDMIAWIYGSGFPKSLDVSKAIDKAAGAEREVVGNKKAGQSSLERKRRVELGYRKRETNCDPSSISITAPATPEAQQWSGWGTALKPALEPITVARKPLAGTVAENVLRHGTGALNIDGCRVAHVTVEDASLALNPHLRGHVNGGNGGRIFPSEEGRRVVTPHEAGRWPANLIHDGSEEAVELFPRNVKGQIGMSKTDGGFRFIEGDTETAQKFDYGTTDIGSAARFFYAAKTSKSDRSEGNDHPTVKPTDLMRYLCRLVTPPDGIILDPFMGSGSTGKAAMLEGFDFIGIESERHYYEIADLRVSEAANRPQQTMIF